jgi:hypothetical protein
VRLGSGTGCVLFSGVTWFTWAARGVSCQCQTSPVLGVRFGVHKWLLSQELSRARFLKLELRSKLLKPAH